MPPLTGDFRVLDDWMRRIDSLGSPSSIREVSGLMAAETLTRTDEQFTQQRDPFGRAWAPKKRPDGRRVGQGRTGRLRSTYHVKNFSRFGFTIGSEATYRRFFQRERPLSPGSTLPQRWDAGYDRIWNGYCFVKLGRRA